jgi:hypothetical protein
MKTMGNQELLKLTKVEFQGLCLRLEKVKQTLTRCMSELEKSDFDKRGVIYQLDMECQFINDELGYISQFSY